MFRVNPRVDFAFKKLFGSEENKDLLMSLINAMVDERDQVADLVLMNPYSLAAYQAGKMSVLDIKARDDRGRWFNVEMQIGSDSHFDKRAIFYWARMVTEQLAAGDMYDELQKSISINILNFDYTPTDDHYHSMYRILNVATGRGDSLHDLFELHYVELLKFKKEFHEIATALDRWTAFLAKAHRMDRKDLPPPLSQDRAILKALDEVERMYNAEEREIYEVKLKAYRDEQSRMASALKEGLEEGLKKGLEEGLETGRKEGLEAGRLEGLAAILQRQIKKRFGHIADTDLQDRLRQASPEQLETWADRILDARSVDEVFAEDGA